MADVIIVNKIDSATPEQIAQLDATIAEVNPTATVVKANSQVTADDPDAIRGKRVLVVEDGPTLTHGEMKYRRRRGGGPARGRGRDRRPSPVGVRLHRRDVTRSTTSAPVLPAMGYCDEQLAELEKIIDAADVDLVVIATPIDLRKLIDISKPAVRVRYDLDVLPESPDAAPTSSNRSSEVPGPS